MARAAFTVAVGALAQGHQLGAAAAELQAFMQSAEPRIIAAEDVVLLAALMSGGELGCMYVLLGPFPVT